jgi:hypothetical protein
VPTYEMGIIINGYDKNRLIQVAARSKARVCGRSLAGTAVSNTGRRHGCLSVVSLVCWQGEVSASG